VTSIPHPSVTATPVIASECPPAASPALPERPSAFIDYPQVLATFLTGGGSPQELEGLLRDWKAVTEELGVVRSVDMTGDKDLEVVVSLVDPAPSFDLPWPPGDLLIFQCRGGAVEVAYQGRRASEEEMVDLQFQLEQVADVNGTGRADVVYTTSSCGAHTCWDRLFIIEWDGEAFVNRVPGMAEFPYATFTVNDGQILVDVGGIGSAGAGYQRTYQEAWSWDGHAFALREQIVGPPTALIHYIHDGDEALALGDYGTAINRYQAALDDDDLPAGLFSVDAAPGEAIVRAYAHFKLVVAYAASGDTRAAQSQYEALITENPEGTVGHPYAQLGQAFWDRLEAGQSAREACAAAVAVAVENPALAENLYAGYANPEYQPADLCRLGE
jgi:hypothetical protein